MHAVPLARAGLDLDVGARLLPEELITRKSEYSEPALLVFVLQRVQPLVLGRGEASFRRDVHDHDDLAREARHRQTLAGRSSRRRAVEGRPPRQQLLVPGHLYKCRRFHSRGRERTKSTRKQYKHGGGNGTESRRDGRRVDPRQVISSGFIALALQYSTVLYRATVLYSTV